MHARFCTKLRTLKQFFFKQHVREYVCACVCSCVHVGVRDLRIDGKACVYVFKKRYLSVFASNECASEQQQKRRGKKRFLKSNLKVVKVFPNVHYYHFFPPPHFFSKLQNLKIKTAQTFLPEHHLTQILPERKKIIYVKQKKICKDIEF